MDIGQREQLKEYRDDVFFFQAEDGIRDLTVTGVQTCALPISSMMTPPETKAYLLQVIRASNIVMKNVLRNFDQEDVDLLVPEPNLGGGNEQAGDRKSVV